MPGFFTKADWKNSIGALLADPAVRQGIKMAIAGILAFYCALWNRLENPSWCVLTVIVLMVVTQVGAIVEKSFFRSIGTLAGGVIGVWLIGSFSSQPVFLLVVVFLVTAAGTALFGGNRYPYAFYLTALTLIVVVTDCMKSPDRVFNTAVARGIEINVGTAASLLVTLLVWPRYASVEFRDSFRGVLRDLGRIVATRSKLSPSALESPVADLEKGFALRLNGLRLMLHFGQRENGHFRGEFP